MAILVDELFDWKQNGSLWAHMMSDTSSEELHTFAMQIGLKRAWCHHGDHYDLRPSKHALAIQYGAQLVSKFDLARLRIAKRKPVGAAKREGE